MTEERANRKKFPPLIGISSIGSAVAHFGNSLNYSEEAALQAARAKSLALDTFGFYRQAFGDSETPKTEAATIAIQAALAEADVLSGLLEKAKGAVRSYVASVAPRMQLEDRGHLVRVTPTGDELLDTHRRPRTPAAMANRLANQAKDATNFGKTITKDAHGVVDLLKPPDPSSLRSVTHSPTPGPMFEVGHQAPGSAGGGDATVSVVLGAVSVIKIVQVTISRLIKLMGRGQE